MDDLISRQTAIDEAKRLHDVAWTNWKETRISANTMIDALEQLPSAERKKGRWLPVRGYGGGYWVCSSCKNPTEAFAADVLYKYCPFCGADMRGEKE